MALLGNTNKEGAKNEEKKKAVFALAVIGVVAFLFLWRFVLSPPATDYHVPMPAKKTAPNIDFEYLQSDEFRYFGEYETIDPLEEEMMGRENPFLPY